MNALNLRVSSVKTNENVRKSAAMRAALVKLPQQYGESEESFCLELKNAKTVPDQVACAKRTFETMGNDGKILQFLCDLHFSSPLKHPVRNQILKLLITASKTNDENLDESSIVKALECSIQQMLEESERNSESVSWNTTIASLSGCFDNFESGLKAFGQNIAQVFSFICLSVNKYITELTPITSPSVRNEYYLHIHNSIRVLLNCIQEFGDSLKTTHSKQLRQLSALCKDIVLDGDIPMDPRTNAAILMAYVAKLFQEYHTFVSHAKDIRNPQEIALCSGVINTCGEQDFQQYSAAILDICEKIDEIGNANATVPNILLCATRAMYQASKLTLHFALKAPQTLEDVKLILDKLMTYSVAFMEHHMDSVRHLCRDVMRNVLAVSKMIQNDSLLKNIYDACNSERISLSVKCILLQQAGYVLGADDIIRNCPTLFTKLFADNLGKDFIVNSLYDALMIANYKEQPFEKWTNTWIMYLLNVASFQDSRLPDIETLIVKSVKCDARVVQHIIFSENEQAIPISTKLSTLWAVRRSGIKFENYPEIMDKFSKHLQLSILSGDDETRLMALRLLVETHKTTEPLTAMECDHFITYLKYNVNGQCPATRQKSLGLLSKALARCCVGLQKKMKGKQFADIMTEQPLELKFLQDFMRILVENIFEGANFSRRSVSLQLLQQCLTIGVHCDLMLLPLLPKTTVKSLTETLADTYESNNELAVNMLKLLENNQEEGSLITNFGLEINLTELQNLLTSVKPSDSVTASFQLEFLCHRASPSIFGDFDLPLHDSTMYAALRWLMLELQEGLKLAQFSILEAAKLNPLYGILLAIKHLLTKLDFRRLSEERLWRSFIAELIVFCKDLTNVVAVVVNSESPEGHLPNDFGEFPEEFTKNLTLDEVTKTAPCKILSAKLRKSDMSSLKTTPQMVLLCAWRTVKEVSLILGYVVLYSPIQFTNTTTENFLITKEQILEIGDHFKLLLSETKHRGAFEQAYVGFSKLCCRLWAVEAVDLNILPMLWLKDLITIISQEDVNNGKICSTRRSAGVPFMVQALITSELKVGSTKALMFCMTHLLKLAASKDNSSESRTHAMNILRALFRCADLNDAVGEYVSDGVTAAISGYDANNWSEKNSATLLFAALITRIFGVQRTKDSDNLNIRNKMTGRVFFIRYPKLYDFFLEELQKASELIGEQQKAHKLHPLLLILSRLYASALEGTESNLKLSQFIPYISKCGGCPEMTTRYLAAKAIVALINKDDVTNMLRRKCAEIVLMTDRSYELKLNLLHGYLLQIFYLLKNHKSILNEELIADITSSIVGLRQSTALKNAVILKVTLDIFTEILNSLSSLNFQPAVVQQLLHFSTQPPPALSDPSMAFYYTVLYKSNFLYNLHIMRLTLPSEAVSVYMLDPPVTTMPLEQAETCLNIILLLLINANSTSSKDNSTAVQYDLEMLEEFEILPAEFQFFKSLNRETLQELSLEMKNSKALHLALRKLLEIPKYYPEAAMKAYAILSLLTQFDFALPQLIELTKKQADDVKSPLTMCVERVLQKQGVEYECAQLCLEYLMEIAHPSQPYSLRIKAANSMSHISVHYPKSLEMKRMLFIRSYIKLMLDLLMDDDYDIREFAAKLVLRCLPGSIELHLADDSQSKQTVHISQHTDSVVSTLAQRVFLQYTADLLQNYNMDDDYILDIFKIIVSQCPFADDQHNSSSSLMDVEIFEKSEANDFAEPLTAVIDAVGIFTRTFRKHSKVVQYVKSYMLDLTGRGLIN